MVIGRAQDGSRCWQRSGRRAGYRSSCQPPSVGLWRPGAQHRAVTPPGVMSAPRNILLWLASSTRLPLGPGGHACTVPAFV
jgi:hypothetical protein